MIGLPAGQAGLFAACLAPADALNQTGLVACPSNLLDGLPPHEECPARAWRGTFAAEDQHAAVRRDRLPGRAYAVNQSWMETPRDELPQAVLPILGSPQPMVKGAVARTSSPRMQSRNAAIAKGFAAAPPNPGGDAGVRRG